MVNNERTSKLEFTGITKKNRIFFTHLAPKELLQKAGTYDCFGIGAAQGIRPNLKGRAVLLFCFREDSDGERYQ